MYIICLLHSEVHVYFFYEKTKIPTQVYLCSGSEALFSDDDSSESSQPVDEESDACETDEQAEEELFPEDQLERR